jgi:isocitrate/isopropylmalate dehydrogenase
LAERRSENTLFAAAANLDEALDVMLTDEKTRTPDLGGSLSTSEFGKALSIRLDTQH